MPATSKSPDALIVPLAPPPPGLNADNGRRANVSPISVGVSVAAQMVGVSRSRMYELINSQAVKSVMIGGRRLVLVSSLRALVGEQDAA